MNTITSPDRPTRREFFRGLLPGQVASQLGEAAHKLTAEYKFEHPNFHTFEVSTDMLADASRGDYAALIADLEKILQSYEVDTMVFRGLEQPAGNIAPQLATQYGTDRFEGYDAMNHPRHDDGTLVPFRSSGRSGQLTADTYAVPELKWALQFTGLGNPDEQRKIVSGQVDAYIIGFNAEHLQVSRRQAGGGEQWRGEFLGDPRDAFVCMVKLEAEK